MSNMLKLYQEQANRTAPDGPKIADQAERLSMGWSINLTHACFGLCTETGELLEALADTEALNVTNLIEELGDLLWYCALLATALQLDLHSILYGVMRSKEATTPGMNLYRRVAKIGMLTGSIADNAKRCIFYGKPIDMDGQNGVRVQLFVLLFQVRKIAEENLAIDIETVMERNITKLRTRFPNKFTEEDAIARADKQS